MTGATHVTRHGARCVDLAALDPRSPRHRQLAGVSGAQEFHLCLFDERNYQWVNAGNLRPLRSQRRRSLEEGVWAPLLALLPQVQRS